MGSISCNKTKTKNMYDIKKKIEQELNQNEYYSEFYRTDFKNSEIRLVKENFKKNDFNAKAAEKKGLHNYNDIRNFHEKIDNRQKVEGNNLYKSPCSSIGIILSIYKGKKELYGTGALIGSKSVLTCAHNIYDDDKNHPEKIFFIIGIEGESHYRKIEIEKKEIPEDYLNDPISSSEDYAVLILKEPLEKFGYFGLVFLPHDEFQQKLLSLYGFPQDKKLNETFELWGSSGNIDYYEFKEKQFRYNKIFTKSGQSGSPIYFEENNCYYICGIHTSGDLYFGYGIHIDMDRFNKINIWSGKRRKKFEIFNFNIGNKGIELLINEKKKLNYYSEINLSNNKISDEGFINFLKLKDLDNLEILDFSNNLITDNWFSNLIDLPNLKTFIMKRNRLTGKIFELIGNNLLKNLKLLNIDDNNISDINSEKLDNKIFTNLTELSMNNNKIGKFFSKYIEFINNHNFPKLEILYMNQNKILIIEKKELNLQNLIHLHLDSNYLNDESIQMVFKSKIPKLENLHLENNKISKRGLINKIPVNSLKKIYLKNTNLYIEDLILLQKKYKNILFIYR